MVTIKRGPKSLPGIAPRAGALAGTPGTDSFHPGSVLHVGRWARASLMSASNCFVSVGPETWDAE